MDAIAAIALGLKLIAAARDAIALGDQDITEDALDAALSDLAASDQRLSDAIARARAREAGD